MVLEGGAAGVEAVAESVGPTVELICQVLASVGSSVDDEDMGAAMVVPIMVVGG